MKNNKLLEKMLLAVFLASLFVFKIPNFYIFPFTENAFLTSQSLARICIVLLFCYKTLQFFLQGKEILKTRNARIIMFLIIALFTIQTLSVTQAVNYTSFLNRYKDVVLGICSFFVFYYYRRSIKSIIFVLAFSVLFNAFIQVILLLSPTLFLNIFSPFLYRNYLNLLIANLDRGRFYIAAFDEILLPFLLIPVLWTTFRLRFLQIALFTSTIFFALASNIRSNVLMVALSCISSLFLFRFKLTKRLIFACVGILVLAVFANRLITQLVGFSFYDRLTFQSQSEDVDTISQRRNQIGEAFMLANSSILGIGLGNYYDRVQIQKIEVSYLESRRNEIRAAKEYIHNIFASIAAESGYVGLLTFCLLLLVFLKNDYVAIKSKKSFKIACVVAFWTLLAWGLFNPAVSGTYQFLFWGFRGLLIPSRA